MPDVVVTENIVGSPMDSLRGDFDVLFDPDLWKDPQKLLSAVASTKALVVRNQTRVTAEVIRAGEDLRVIARAGAGLNNIDVEAATEAGVVVAYTPDENSVSVAELALGLMLALARKIPAADRDTRTRRVGSPGVHGRGADGEDAGGGGAGPDRRTDRRPGPGGGDDDHRARRLHRRGRTSGPGSGRPTDAAGRSVGPGRLRHLPRSAH